MLRRILFLRLIYAASAILFFSLSPVVSAAAPPAPNPQSSPVGVEGQVNGPPPDTAAIISVPGNGQRFTTTPITVSGICKSGLLVEIFDNNVFVGAASCVGSSFTLQIDLFDGQNDLVAKVFDALNQKGPDSTTVSVLFRGVNSAGGATRPTLTTAYAKRGANPGDTLTWPITLSGGTGPYALNVDWGDKTNMDLISRSAAGVFNIEHVYKQSGVFIVTVKATDANGSAAFLQLVGISNGPIQQNNSLASKNITVKRVIIWWPLMITFVLTLIAFWLGKRHQLQVIRDRLHRGERPI
jgi:hypothetical protein